MIDEIAAFVEARLADDERIAQEATEGVSRQTDDPWSGIWSTGASYQPGLIEDSGGGVVVYDEGSPSAAQAVHIARHDPARVLRDVAAKRRILAEVVTRIDELDRHLEADYVGGDNTTGESDLLLKLLAAPYADHPAYREEWRP